MEATTLSNGLTIVNVTAHEFRFLMPSGTIEAVPPSGVRIDAQAEETVTIERGMAFVTPMFVPNAAGLEALASIEAEYPNAIILGSLLAAQGYAGRIAMAIAAPGYERVPPAEKLVRSDKFTRY